MFAHRGVVFKVEYPHWPWPDDYLWVGAVNYPGGIVTFRFKTRESAFRWAHSTAFLVGFKVWRSNR